MFIQICSILVIFLICISTFQHNLINAESTNKVPSWVKMVVNWWLDGTITDSQLSQGIIFLTDNKIIKMSENNKNFKNENDTTVSIKSDRGNFSNHYMKIEDYGVAPYPGRIATSDPHGKGINSELIEVWLRQTQYFEKQVSDLNKYFKLPNNIYIGLGECQEKNAFYNKNSKMIVMCYELILDTYDKFLIEYESDKITKKQATIMTLNVIDYIFYHQLAHALFDTMYIPNNQEIEKNEERMMDSFANQIRISMQSDSESNKITSVAAWFKIMNQTQNENEKKVWNSHEFNFERFFNMTCENSGVSRIKTLDLIEKGFILNEKLIECKIKYIEQKEKLEIMINPILK
jgi:hypothetical protein